MTENHLGNDDAPKDQFACVLDENDDGGVLAVTSGDLIRIRLDENPSTGYTWVLNPGPATMVVGNELADISQQDRELVGAPATRQWDLRVFLLDPGMCTLAALLVRPWEKTPIKTWSVRLDIKASPAS
jgi:inhibitor of cysteine peptidase